DSGEAQIKQLMALRYLAEQPDLIKKAKDKTEALTTLGKIAKGELANDKQGFAKEYATRVLQAVEGGKETSRPASLALEDAPAWCPVAATLAVVLDSRHRESTIDAGKSFRQLTSKFMRQQEWDQVFKVFESLGNVRIERVAFAYVEDAN